ncbi:ABC transporter permease [Alkalibaculum sp. M08DMB]|uniref:ABC transporter permease n=1 Tax=Alkalibaculum sporogenes TaxID=2655001 RepID=A0A6A7K8M2_9FIRM|nr:ABC transporter permease [Alkalibaculum sporogenes]MPW25453.1 ABC transporter permease [Alkalibaculum sporogenes]
MILRSSKFVFKRIVRDITSLGILFIMPLVLITILGMISDDALNQNLGIPMVDSVALSIILAFQLFAGFYTLELIKHDLLGARKWRLKSLPIAINRYMFSIILVTTIYGGLQSYVITHYTRIIYGVTWGNQGRLILGIILISFVVQVMYLNLALSLDNYKSMERSATTIALLSMLFGGVWFQLPDNIVLNFMGTYGNPYSLAQNVLLYVMKNQVTYEGMISIGIYVLLAGGLLVLSEFRGRRLF